MPSQLWCLGFVWNKYRLRCFAKRLKKEDLKRKINKQKIQAKNQQENMYEKIAIPMSKSSPFIRWMHSEPVAELKGKNCVFYCCYLQLTPAIQSIDALLFFFYCMSLLRNHSIAPQRKKMFKKKFFFVVAWNWNNSTRKMPYLTSHRLLTAEFFNFFIISMVRHFFLSCVWMSVLVLRFLHTESLMYCRCIVYCFFVRFAGACECKDACVGDCMRVTQLVSCSVPYFVSSFLSA